MAPADLGLQPPNPEYCRVGTLVQIGELFRGARIRAEELRAHLEEEKRRHAAELARARQEEQRLRKRALLELLERLAPWTREAGSASGTPLR